MNCPEAEMVQTIFGHEAKGTAVVAFCHYHRAFMTVPEMKRKKCLQKRCNRLEKCDCNFWIERERKKERKRLKKEAGIPVYQRVKVKTDHNGEIIGIENKKGV